MITAADFFGSFVYSVGCVATLFYTAKLGGRFILWVKMRSREEKGNLLNWIKKWMET